MLNLLSKLVEAPSISGSEQSVREVIQKELKPYVDEIRVDKIGNLIARKGKGSPKILLAAHMDQLGLMVKYIDKQGFIFFETIGGWDERVLPGIKVHVQGSKGAIVGVIGTKPVHLQDKDEQKVSYKLKELFIDIGANGREEVEKAGVSIGDFITRSGEVSKMIGSKATGAGFDNRVGCAVLIETVKRLKGFKGTVYAAGTVQEELGLIGVRGTIFGLEPDIVIALDTNIAGDTPEVKPQESALQLGKGVTVDLKDAISITNQKAKKWVIETSKQSKIKVQFNVMSGGATDASIAPMIREGIPSVCLAVPVRYVHTPVEVVDMNDMESTVKFAVECVKSAGKYF
ncbi:MAG: M42 family metallopeptidase [Candidatus Aenigmarchaeota archaeon]|nr:M42 family metallopeptidase [Candidatus Aenigmarchaeota archaeon]